MVLPTPSSAGVEQDLARLDVEPERSECLGVIVQPVVRQVVPRCDTAYGLAQFNVESADRVDVTGCVA